MIAGAIYPRSAHSFLCYHSPGLGSAMVQSINRAMLCCVAGLPLLLFSARSACALPHSSRNDQNNATNISPALSHVPANSTKGPTNKVVTTTLLSSDPTFQFQLVLMNGLATYHGSETNDILKTAEYIEPGNFESFAEAMYALASATRAKAETALRDSDAVNARDTYFAAASYFRGADFYLHGNWSDPRIDDYWKLQTECYDKALAALPVPGERLNLQADGFTVPAIFYAPEAAGSKVQRPTIIMGNGYDAAQVGNGRRLQK